STRRRRTAWPRCRPWPPDGRSRRFRFAAARGNDPSPRPSPRLAGGRGRVVPEKSPSLRAALPDGICDHGPQWRTPDVAAPLDRRTTPSPWRRNPGTLGRRGASGARGPCGDEAQRAGAMSTTLLNFKMRPAYLLDPERVRPAWWRLTYRLRLPRGHRGEGCS